MTTKYWRDLRIGELKQVGDRFLDNGSWILIKPENLELEFTKTYTEFSKPTQREADCVPPTENGSNRYGLDVRYFRSAINRELNRSLDNYKPHELARVFARLSVTADSQVIFEDEFQRKTNRVEAGQ